MTRSEELDLMIRDLQKQATEASRKAKLPFQRDLRSLRKQLLKLRKNKNGKINKNTSHNSTSNN